ncbi:MAG TPA: hypothetical protein DEH78_03855 [Solibacterales bacterium]|nr:hypothetical protein [Bryobacterales bacterium]
MSPWVWVFAIVGCTAASDLLQSREMKRPAHRYGYLALAVLFLAASFFSFLELLKVADLSFAVPATASSFVVETLLARWILKEQVTARRWTGTCLVACGVALLAL